MSEAIRMNAIPRAGESTIQAEHRQRAAFKLFDRAVSPVEPAEVLELLERAFRTELANRDFSTIAEVREWAAGVKQVRQSIREVDEQKGQSRELAEAFGADTKEESFRDGLTWDPEDDE